MMKKSVATSLGKAAAFSAIALAVTAAVAQDAERTRAHEMLHKRTVCKGCSPDA